MSLKDRLNNGHKKPAIEISRSEVSTFMNDTPLNQEFADLKEKLHALLIDKVNSTANWSQYTDDDQKNLIKQFIEFQISTNFRNTPLNKVEKDRLIREIIQEAKLHAERIIQDAENERYKLLNESNLSKAMEEHA